jgi:hypothetical protein
MEARLILSFFTLFLLRFAALAQPSSIAGSLLLKQPLIYDFPNDSLSNCPELTFRDVCPKKPWVVYSDREGNVSFKIPQEDSFHRTDHVFRFMEP